MKIRDIIPKRYIAESFMTHALKVQGTYVGDWNSSFNNDNKFKTAHTLKGIILDTGADRIEICNNSAAAVPNIVIAVRRSYHNAWVLGKQISAARHERLNLDRDSMRNPKNVSMNADLLDFQEKLNEYLIDLLIEKLDDAVNDFENQTEKDSYVLEAAGAFSHCRRHFR